LLQGDRVRHVAIVRCGAAITLLGCLAVGFSPLAPIAILIVIQAMLHLRTVYGNEGADQMTMLILIASAFGEIGRDHPAIPATAAVFVGGQIGLSYVASGTAKLFGPMWRNGTALPNIMNHHAYGSAWLSQFFIRYPRITRLLGMGVIGFQFSFWIFYLIPMPFAWLYIVGGICFHLAIAIFMRLYLFLIVFLGTYPCLLFAHQVVWSLAAER
jgi:hypothetical protein